MPGRVQFVASAAPYGGVTNSHRSTLRAGGAFPSLSAQGHEVVDPAAISVESVMTPETVTLGPGETVFAAARLLRARRIGAVPIVADGRLVGILARSDLLHALATLAEEGQPAS